MYQVVITNSAQNDIQKMASFILQDCSDTNVAFKYITKIEEACLSLKQFPDGRAMPQYRLLRLQAFRFLKVEKHLIFYKYDDMTHKVIIFRILHHKMSYQHFL